MVLFSILFLDGGSNGNATIFSIWVSGMTGKRCTLCQMWKAYSFCKNFWGMDRTISLSYWQAYILKDAFQTHGTENL